MKKRVKNYNRYPNSLKRKVAKAYLSGRASYAILAEENGLRDRTVVKEFVKWYRRQMEKDREIESKKAGSEGAENVLKPGLEARLEELKKELEKAELKVEMLETMIDLAEDRFNVEIRKKSGARQ